MKQLRWGLLCTARINRYLIPQIKASTRNKLSAVASRSAQRAENYAQDWSIPRSLGSYKALLEDSEIDVVYNSLPNHLHAEWTVKALKAGKHVLCEKPLALTVEEVDAIAEAAQNTGRIVSEAFMYRHHERTRKVRELVEAGTIGELNLIRGSFSFDLTRGQNDIRWNPDIGGGSLWDVGCYPVSFTRYLTDKLPAEVFGQKRVGPTGIDLTFGGQLRFPGHLIAHVDAGFQAPLRMEMEIVGNKGAIRLPRAYKPQTNSTIHIVQDDVEKILKVKGQELYRGEIEDMASAVLDDKPPRISLQESRDNVAILTALHASARSGEPVRLNEHA